MNITVLGIESNLEETQKKFGAEHQYLLVRNDDLTQHTHTWGDVVFDFRTKMSTPGVELYRNHNGIIFLNSVTTTLARLETETFSATIFGFCGIPTFLDRELLEVSVRMEGDRKVLDEVCTALHTRYEVVGDRVGLVTPRVICTIINEAYLALEEGIATREDIDMAMKLGTNYPWGPFEWSERIGVSNVLRLLEALCENKNDGSYKVSSMLRQG